MHMTTEDASRAAPTLRPARVPRNGAQRIVDLTVFVAIAAGLVLTIARFLGWFAPPEEPVVDLPPETAVHDAAITLQGWDVTHRIHEANASPTAEQRIDRLRELAARLQSGDLALPLAPDPVETGFQTAQMTWTLRERIGPAEIRDTGGVPGTGAVFLVDSRDPAGNETTGREVQNERVAAWLAEIPLSGGRTQAIETTRTGLASAAVEGNTAKKFGQQENGR